MPSVSPITPSAQNAIHIKDVSKSFAHQHVLSHISLQIPAGESFVLLGRSGSGKSVLLRCLLGLCTPDAGHSYLQQICLHKANEKQQRHVMQATGVVFQGSALFDSLLVWQNICFTLMRSPGKMRSQDALDKAKSLLEQVGLNNDTAYKRPAELSGGMQRRVALARAIAQNPKVLLLDEPTAGLDPVFSHKIAQLIQKLRKRLKATVLTITHDLHLAQTIGDRIGVLDKGQLVAHGPFQALQQSKHPSVQKLLAFA